MSVSTTPVSTTPVDNPLRRKSFCDNVASVGILLGEGIYMRRLPLLIGLLGLALAIAYAQTGGQITGVVTDPSGALIPSAAVTVTNTATNVARLTTTNASGIYSFPDMTPGMYAVKE